MYIIETCEVNAYNDKKAVGMIEYNMKIHGKYKDSRLFKYNEMYVVTLVELVGYAMNVILKSQLAL